MVWRNPDTWTNRWVNVSCHFMLRFVFHFANYQTARRCNRNLLTDCEGLLFSIIRDAKDIDLSPISPALALHRTFFVNHSHTSRVCYCNLIHQRVKVLTFGFRQRIYVREKLFWLSSFLRVGRSLQNRLLRGGRSNKWFLAAMQKRVLLNYACTRDLGWSASCTTLATEESGPAAWERFPPNRGRCCVAAGATTAALQLVECRPVSQATTSRWFPRSSSL